jgi:hypothetical protein
MLLMKMAGAATDPCPQDFAELGTKIKTKRMTGVDEDFLRVFAKSERGLGAATTAEVV